MHEAKITERTDTAYSVVIQDAIDRELRVRGYRRDDENAAAMILSFQVTVNDAVKAYPSHTTTDVLDESLEYGVRWRLPQGAKPVRMERLSPADEVTFLAEGTLHIGAFAPDKSPMWHAMGHKILNRSHTVAQHRVVLERSVTQILRQFPPRDGNRHRAQ